MEVQLRGPDCFYFSHKGTQGETASVSGNIQLLKTTNTEDELSDFFKTLLRHFFQEMMSEIFCSIVFLQRTNERKMNVFMNQLSDICCSALDLQRMQGLQSKAEQIYCSCSGSRSFSFSLDGDLYAGTSVDFMGANAAIFRTSIQGSSQHYIRTEAYDHNWLNGKKLRSCPFVLFSVRHTR